MTQHFVHLRLHSEFSLQDGLVRIKPLVKSVAAMGMPAVAITDQCNFFALIKFFKAARDAGIKPIFGSDFLLQQDDADSPASLISLLARNEQGYRNLIALMSRAYQHGQSQGIAYVRREWIDEHADGVIALSGARFGDVGRALLSGKRDQAVQLLKGWMKTFPDSFYLELQRTGRYQDEDHVHAAVDLAEQFGCPVVASNDVRFIDAEEFEAHEARVCIHQGVTLDDPRREKRYSAQQYLRSPEEMQELFADIPEALENTLEIAKRCTVSLTLGKHFLPEYPIPEGMTTDEFFRQISAKGLNERLDFLFDREADNFAAIEEEYFARLNFELDIICQMGFPGYFLIVMDFIQWAKDHDIPVGPGRGSGAGSLVAYALKITDLDPIEYDLLFERFLNPERVSMPDFDVDFCMEKRDQVINYVAGNYGRDAVSQIVTFGTMAAKAVVRDVARVQGKSYALGDKLSKMIPFEIGITLEKALEQEDTLRDFLNDDDDAQEIWDMAVQLEGLTRGVGKHAGGVVIAPTKLIDFAPLYCDEQGEGLVTQYDKDDVEQAGLVKFDFLGLRTLTIIDWAVKIIDQQRQRSGEDRLDIMAISLQDQATFQLLQKAETTAVFQLESRGMKDLIKRLLPSRFEDIVALVALFRPGPLQSGMVDDFINRKHGRAEVAYPHPQYQHKDLIPVLEPTYGIILYQEQVMQIAQVLAKYSLGQADLLRRAMGKKKAEVMAEQRAIFLEGAKANGIDEDLGGNIFDLMEKFAGYGFNKSHSAAYALVSYQTAWLKAHYPAPFMAAVMSADMQNTDKIVILVDECRAMGLELINPDVNSGEFMFTVDVEGRIVYGLGAIKGLGEGPIENIIATRKASGEFSDLFDFCARTDPKKVNKRAIEALIRAGAFDLLGVDRALLLAAMPEAVLAAEQSARNQDAGMSDLFGDVLADDSGRDVYQSVRLLDPMRPRDRLAGEKDTLGLYLTGHPIDEYEREIRKFSRNRIVDLKADKNSQVVVGLIISLRTVKTKRGDTMAIITLDDRSARIDVTVFADMYQQHRDILVKDAIVVFEGEVRNDDYSGGMKLQVRSVSSLTEARQKHAKALRIRVDQAQVGADFPARLRALLGPGVEDGCPLRVDYQRSDAVAGLLLGDSWRQAPSDELLQKLGECFGDANVELDYVG